MKPGRNDTCPCGSGKKYKRCCGAEPADAQASPMLSTQHIGLLVGLVDRNRLSEAEHQCRTLLTTHPDAGMLWKILSVALMRQRKDALPALRRTAELLPSDAEAHGNLASVLHEQGQWAEAVASYERSLALNPRSIEILNDLGNVLRDLGERRASLSLFARAVELEPGHAPSHCNLGHALLEIRRPEDAAASYRRALVLEPAYALAHLSLATALRIQGRAGEAQTSCEAALALDPASAEALSLLGELNADRGKFTESEALFQRAIAVDPRFPFAFYAIATHRKMTGDDGAWLQGAQALLDKRIPLRHEISLRYAMGKYFDDIGEYDTAFDNYRLANELTKRYGSTYDKEKLTARVDEIIGLFAAEFLHRHRADGSSSEQPVFIIGMPRSGTSLTEQILASHPAVFGAGELTFWGAAFADVERAGLARLGADGVITTLAKNYLHRLTSLSKDALRVVDKMPANFLYAGLIHLAFPRARIIHMQRHPIDICLSIYFQNFFNMGPYANDFDNLAHYYREYLRIVAHWRTVLPATTLMDVPYEALVEDQEGWTRKMLNFLGLPWDPQCLDFHRTERVVITTSKWQVRQKIHGASAGRWKHYEKFVGPLLGLPDATERYATRSSP
jgi:tetratricopeptide (TPR) repeat protein